MTTTIVV